jgi:hypothetical protein
MIEKKTKYQDLEKGVIQVTGLTISSHGIIMSKQRRQNVEGLLWLAEKEPLRFAPIVHGKMGLVKLVYGLNFPKKIDLLFQEFEASYAEAWHAQFQDKPLPPVGQQIFLNPDWGLKK